MLSTLQTVPCAPSLPLVGSLPYLAQDTLAFLRNAAKRGPIVDLRIPTTNTFLLTEPTDIHHVLVTMNRSLRKDVYTHDLRRVLGTGLLTSEGDFWRRQRRLAQPAFHGDRVASYAASMVAAAEHLTAELRDGEVRDMHAVLMRLTLDIVVRTLFGSTVELDATSIGAALGTIMDRYASIWPFIVPGYDRVPLPRQRRFRDALALIDGVIGGIIEDRRRSPRDDRRDLLSMLLAARDDDGTRMSDAQLRDEVITLILAGHETTANALTWSLMLLAQHPQCEAALASALASALDGRAPSFADLPRLSAVDDVVTEAMRLYPPAWTIGREVVEPFEIRGTRFRRGAQLWLAQCVTHRDPRFFDEPDLFQPDRWSDGLAKRLPKFAYFPFGGGQRACIGTSFATMEATLVLATLCRRFRFELLDAERVELQASVTLRPRHGLRMRVRAR